MALLPERCSGDSLMFANIMLNLLKTYLFSFTGGISYNGFVCSDANRCVKFVNQASHPHGQNIFKNPILSYTLQKSGTKIFSFRG
jgi:hypothetical protein